MTWYGVAPDWIAQLYSQPNLYSDGLCGVFIYSSGACRCFMNGSLPLFIFILAFVLFLIEPLRLQLCGARFIFSCRILLAAIILTSKTLDFSLSQNWKGGVLFLARGGLFCQLCFAVAALAGEHDAGAVMRGSGQWNYLFAGPGCWCCPVVSRRLIRMSCF